MHKQYFFCKHNFEWCPFFNKTNCKHGQKWKGKTTCICHWIQITWSFFTAGLRRRSSSRRTRARRTRASTSRASRLSSPCLCVTGATLPRSPTCLSRYQTKPYLCQGTSAFSNHRGHRDVHKFSAAWSWKIFWQKHNTFWTFGVHNTNKDVWRRGWTVLRYPKGVQSFTSSKFLNNPGSPFSF